MNALEKLNYLIFKEAERFMQKQVIKSEDLEKKIIKEDNLIIKINPDNENKTFEVFYITLENMSLLINIIFNALKDESNFTLKEKEDIVSDLIDNFISHNDELEGKDFYELTTIFENYSLEDLSQEFFNNNALNDILLGDYCYELICDYDYTLVPQINVLNINDQMRHNLLYIINNLLNKGYSLNDGVTFIAHYLSSNISISRFDKDLFTNLYNDNYKREIWFKNYTIYLSIYDFYKASFIFGDEDVFREFIENNSLEDSKILFFNDWEFRQEIIKNVIDTLSFGYHNDLDKIDKKIIKKFQPMSSIDKFFKNYC